MHWDQRTCSGLFSSAACFLKSRAHHRAKVCIVASRIPRGERRFWGELKCLCTHCFTAFHILWYHCFCPELSDSFQGIQVVQGLSKRSCVPVTAELVTSRDLFSMGREGRREGWCTCSELRACWVCCAPDKMFPCLLPAVCLAGPTGFPLSGGWGEPGSALPCPMLLPKRAGLGCFVFSGQLYSGFLSLKSCLELVYLHQC